jgi:hypothetical protein
MGYKFGYISKLKHSYRFADVSTCLVIYQIQYVQSRRFLKPLLISWGTSLQMCLLAWLYIKKTIFSHPQRLSRPTVNSVHSFSVSAWKAILCANIIWPMLQLQMHCKESRSPKSGRSTYIALCMHNGESCSSASTSCNSRALNKMDSQHLTSAPVLQHSSLLIKCGFVSLL